jgi:hypothetical protein
MFAARTIPWNVTAPAAGCSTPFNPDTWDEQMYAFENKLLMKVSSHCFMRIPLDMDTVIAGAMAKIEAVGAISSGHIMLSEDVSPWRTDHYIAVEKNVPGQVMVRLSGTFITKVFEGPYKEVPKWYRQLNDYVASFGQEAQRTYFSYTMCPNCISAYGKNYVIGFAQIA